MIEPHYIITSKAVRDRYQKFMLEQSGFKDALFLNVTARARFRPWNKPKLWWRHWRHWRKTLRPLAKRF